MSSCAEAIVFSVEDYLAMKIIVGVERNRGSNHSMEKPSYNIILLHLHILESRFPCWTAMSNKVLVMVSPRQVLTHMSLCAWRRMADHLLLQIGEATKFWSDFLFFKLFS